VDTRIPRGDAPARDETRREPSRPPTDLAGTIQLGGKGLRSRCLCKPRSERGAGQFEARNERTTKELRKQIEQARPIQLNRSGLGLLSGGNGPHSAPS